MSSNVFTFPIRVFSKPSNEKRFWCLKRMELNGDSIFVLSTLDAMIQNGTFIQSLCLKRSFQLWREFWATFLKWKDNAVAKSFECLQYILYCLSHLTNTEFSKSTQNYQQFSIEKYPFLQKSFAFLAAALRIDIFSS